MIGSENEMVKTHIRGMVAEQGVETEFFAEVEKIRNLYYAAKESGPEAEGTFILALSYVGMDITK